MIPPGWVDVEISPLPSAKVQAVGHDAAGRRQYIYHPDFVERNARRKYRKLLEFARALVTHPKLILMDVSMPGKNGIEALKVIRDEFPQVRVLMHVSPVAELFFANATPMSCRPARRSG